MLNTIRRLPKFLKNIIFWYDFVEEVDIELTAFKEKLDLKKNFFNPRELTTIQELRDLNRFFGFTIDTSLLNEYYESDPDKIIEYLRSEANNMIFKIISKGTKNYHEYLFNRIQELGYVYVMFHDEQDGILYRAINFYDADMPQVQLDLLNHDFSVAPFVKVTPLQPFDSGFVSQNNLDQDLILDDDTNPWTMDYSMFGVSVSMTKHISAEFVAHQVFVEGSDTFLISNKYLEYLRKSLNFARKASETPHVGLGVTAYSTNVVTAPFNIPTINVATDVSADYVSRSTNEDAKNAIFNYFKLTSDAIVTYYTQSIQNTQIYQDANFDIINITFPVSKTNIEVAGTGTEGGQTAFNYTADYLPVEPNTIRLVYEDTGSVERTIVDDGKGNLYYPYQYSYDDLRLGNIDITDFAIGSINYTTGVISFDTVDTRQETPTTPTPKEGEDINLSYYTHYTFGLENIKIYDDADAEVVNIDFPLISLSKKEYHVSFLIVIDKR